MLDGENFRGRHERGLRGVFDGDDGGLKRDDGFAAADVALQQAVHRSWLFEIGADFGEDTFLRGSGFEGEDALERLAHLLFADTKGDRVFLARGLTVERETELVKKKLLEDEPLLRRRAKRVQLFERFSRLGEMDMDQSLVPRGIAKPRA